MRLSIACSSAVASSHWMARRCEQNIWGLMTPRLRDHIQWLINRPEFPEFKRQNFRNPHMVVAIRQALDYRSTGRAIAVSVLGWILPIAFAIGMGLFWSPAVS